MTPPYPKLDAHLDDAGADAFLVNADGHDSTRNLTDYPTDLQVL